MLYNKLILYSLVKLLTLGLIVYIVEWQSAKKVYPYYWIHTILLTIIIVYAHNALNWLSNKKRVLIDLTTAYVIDASLRSRVVQSLEKIGRYKLDYFLAVLFACFVLIEFYILGLITISLSGIYASILVAWSLILSSLGWIKIVRIIWSITLVCSTTNVVYDMFGPSRSEAISAFIEAHMFLMKRFIILGCIFSFIYLLATIKISDQIKLSYIYNISWMVIYVFIYFAMPFFIFYPRRYLISHINKLKIKSIGHVHNVIKPSPMNVHNLVENIKFVDLNKIVSFQLLKNHIESSSPDPMGINYFLPAIWINLITGVFLYIFLPASVSDLVKSILILL